MNNLLMNDKYSMITEENKQFIIAFDEEITKLGYDSGGSIGSGYCWSKYMIVYKKTSTRSKQVAARIYIREDGIILRIFLNKMDNHAEYLNTTSPIIKDVLTGKHGVCNHCHEEKGKSGTCRFRKAYTIEGITYEKCSGVTFEFWNPMLENMSDYIGLLREFYQKKRS